MAGLRVQLFIYLLLPPLTSISFHSPDSFHPGWLDTSKIMNLQEIHDFLVSLAFRAGEIITNALPDSNGIGSKKNSVDLVTEYDRAVETMISTALKEKYPDYE